MIHGRLKGDCVTRLLIVIILCGVQLQAAAGGRQAAQADLARYAEIQRLIKRNRHLSAHLVLAVDARTVKAVRGHVSERDIPVLVEMMRDKDYGVASAASGLLVTLGKQAMPALLEAAGVRDSSIMSHAQDALRLLEDCYNEALRDVMNPDVCPTDRSSGRPDSGHR